MQTSRTFLSTLVNKSPLAKRGFAIAQPASKQAPLFNASGLKRFYKKVDVIEHPESHILETLKPSDQVTLDNLSLSHDKYWAITLDGRVIKTFYKDRLPVPSRALAVALAEEWECQGDTINLKSMTLN